MKKIISILIFVLPAILWSGLSAQQTYYQDNPINSAHDLFIKDHYGAARNIYSKLIDANDLLQEYDAEKDFYVSASAAELKHGDAAYMLEEYLRKHPQSTRTNRVWLQLGHLYFRNSNYRSAMEAYNNVSTGDMNQEERAEFTFKRGYTLFKSGDMDKAANAFSQMKDRQTKYTGPANYYYAHIMYASGNYETALRDFEKLRNDETFKSVVPYYIIQIYYVQGRYEEMLAMAEPYLEGARNKRTNEMLRLVADAQYRKGNYKEAARLMEEYSSLNRSKMTREDHYMLGFAYYIEREYSKSIPEFQYVTTGNDSLAQNAWYHMGDSYLKTDQKKFASNAFSSAWKIPVRSSLAEDALFNYAKLSVELSHNPYNEAILALQEYLKEYPTSKRRDEAYTYLANLYLVTRNYDEALTNLEQIKSRNNLQNSIYQKITYYRAIELFNNQKYFDAIGLFKKSLAHQIDSKITEGSLLWQGESYYRLGQYDVARNYFRDFLNTAKGHPSYNAAYYNLGYSYLKLKDYAQSKNAFNTFIESRPKDQRLFNDAKLRMADCHLMLKQYKEASALYDQVGNSNASDADYALYHRSISAGVSGDNNQKISSLQKLLSDYPKSPYADDARFEMGQTYLAMKKNSEALSAFQKVIMDYPRSSLVKDALLNTGLIYYNTNRDQQALETLKKVVADYPSTPTAREALAVIRNIYVDMNEVDKYVDYAEDIPFANVSRSEQDSLLYVAAENKYMSGDCEKALPGFKSYLQKFPEGGFSLNAHYYKADCESRTSQYNDALTSYQEIISRPRNSFTENAALYASGILYKMKDYAKALTMYQKLEENAEKKNNLAEAFIGQMRCHYEVGNYAQTIMYAQRVNEMDQTPTLIAAEANLLIGRSANILKRSELARSAFNETIKLSQGIHGAEALYSLSEMAFEMKDYTTAENNVFKLSSDYPAFKYWLAKGFILLSDIYVIQNNVFQAKQTLQSIIDNYEDDDLKKVAMDKLAELEKTEKSTSPKVIDSEAEESIQIK